MSLTLQYSIKPLPAGSTRLGLHHTAEEVTVWQGRRLNGPYKTAGDVSTNSPGDWDRIQTNADTAGLTGWTGQTSSSSWPGSPTPGRTRAERATDQGLIYVLTGTTSYRTKVLDLMLDQIGQVGTDFTDGVRWDSAAWHQDIVWEIWHWGTKMLYAYDYIRADIGSTDRANIDAWFLDFAQWAQTNLDADIENQFPNRSSDDYATGAPTACEGSTHPIYYGGPVTCGNFHYRWENTLMHGPSFYGQVGVMLNNSTLINSAKRCFKEWIRFDVFANNHTLELYRWVDHSTPPSDLVPTLGFSYGGLMIGQMIVLADALARNGDTELYDYSTSLGMQNVTPAGGPKTLLGVIKKHMNLVDHTVTVYGTDQSGNQTLDYRIDTHDEFTGEDFVEDTDFTLANLYYRDAYVESVYKRTASGAPGYPAAPSTGGYAAWRGTWGEMPCVLGMYGDMEDNSANPFL